MPETARTEVVQELLQDLQRELAAGETVAVATIVRRRGSVPREVGAKMLVHRDGRINGTIGGGCGEAEVCRSALNVIDTGRPHTVQISLTEEISLESQGVCGGTFDVFIQPWHSSVTPGQTSMPARLQALQAALEGERAVVLATLIAAGGDWRSSSGQQMLFYENGESLGNFTLPAAPSDVIAELSRNAQTAFATGSTQTAKVTAVSAWAEVFIEPFNPPPVLLIAGAGHIAVPLAALGSLLKFSVSITDDRAAFANRERFPTAKQILVGGIASTLRDYPITPRTHVILVTRAHSHDVQGLRTILDSPAAYIGMIGSQRRVWAVLKLLHSQGVPIEKLLRVRAPIGLDIGGQTPEEIALAIMSEIVLLRHGGTGQPLSDSLRARYQARLQRLESEDGDLDEE